MGLDKERLKTELLKKYGIQLDKMLAELDKSDRLHLTEIEDSALDIRHQVGKDITASLCESASQEREVEVCCPKCARRMRDKGKKGKWIKTRSGEVQVKRSYYYCPSCRVGFFPLDKYWQVDKQGYSSQLNCQIMRLSGLMPFKMVQRLLRDLAQVIIGTTTIWEQVQYHGERLRQYDLKQQRHTSVERTRWTQERYDPFLQRCLSMDGGRVCLREEGWKEIKVGLVSNFKPQWNSKKGGVKLTHMHYTARIDDADTFSNQLWTLAVEHDVPYAGHLVAVADGAPWIWWLVSDLFPVCTQIIDWYHARQQLAKASQDCFKDEDTAKAWFQRMSGLLFRGQLDQLSAELNRLQHPTRYFVTHQRRMQYQHFRAQGLPIGSGGIESGVKQFKHRLTGAGMRWARCGAERMVVMRSAILSDTFDELWAQAA